MEMQHDRGWNSAPPRDEDAGGEATTYPVDNLQTYFDAAMARFLHERQVQQAHQDRMEAREGRGAPVTAAQEGPRVRTHISRQRTMTDVEMESAGTCEYDPDDMDLEGPLERMATAATGQMSNMVSRVKIVATSDLKNFTEEIKMKTEHVTGCPP